MGASFCYRCMAPLDNEVEACPKCKGAIPYIPTDPKDIAPGTLLHSRFIIGRSIGRGGFGATYLAYDLLNRDACAVKEFFPDKMCQRSPDRIRVIPNADTEYWYKNYKRNFIEEARRLFDLTAHPGVVNVIEQFEENNTAYFAMEYIDGETLKEYMRRYPQGLAPKEAMQIIAEVLQALSPVHAAGLLHRDISADNIMRTKQGSIKLIDFGSARDTQQNSKTVFTKGVYTAPEQKLGDKQRSCTDLYAVGVVMFLLLVGRVPSLPDGHMESLRNAYKGLNEETYRLFEISTAMNPNYRYQRAEDMLADLERAMHTLPRGLKARKKNKSGKAGKAGKSGRSVSAERSHNRSQGGRKNAKMQKLKTYLLLLGLVLLLLIFVLMIIASL